MQMIIQWLETLAREIPITWFVFVGSLVEEIIAPIPSPLVMMLAGSISATQNSPIIFLLLLAVIGAFSKTIGSFIIYQIADKTEDVLIDNFGKFLGVSHADTEGLGAFLSKGKRDDFAVFLLRAVPIMPTAPVSVVAGLIKIDLKTYLISTFLGLTIRNSIYLYLGYISLGAIESFNEGFESLEKIGYLILSILGMIALLWIYRKRQKSSPLKAMEDIFLQIKNIFKFKK